MSITYSIASGGLPAWTAQGGVAGTNPFVELIVNLPDAFPGNVSVFGNVKGVNANGSLMPTVQVAGTPALPAVPGGGTTYWNLQIDPFTGVATIYTSSTVNPAAQPCAGANSATLQLIVFASTIPSTATIPWMQLPTLTDFNL
jgi:hypothetical protein